MTDKQHPDWEHIRATALSPSAASGWPDSVKSISMNGLSLLGLDPDMNLYWDGRLVEVKKPFSLTFWQKVGAILTVLSAVVVASMTCVSVYLEITRPLCGS